jgi:transcriptional regulator GlxA family with amidase domain
MTKIPEIPPGDAKMPSAIRVAFVAYEGVSLLDLSGPLEALRVASTHPTHLGASLVYACSVHGGPIMTADGVRIVTEPRHVGIAPRAYRDRFAVA